MKQTYQQKQQEMRDKQLTDCAKWKAECEMLGFYYEVKFDGSRKKIII